MGKDIRSGVGEQAILCAIRQLGHVARYLRVATKLEERIDGTKQATERRLARERAHLEEERAAMRSSLEFIETSMQLALLVGVQRADAFIRSVELVSGVCSVLDLQAAVWHAVRGESLPTEDAT